MQTLITISQLATLLFFMGGASHLMTQLLQLRERRKAAQASLAQFDREQAAFIEPLCEALRNGDKAKAAEIRRAAKAHADSFKL